MSSTVLRQLVLCICLVVSAGQRNGEIFPFCKVNMVHHVILQTWQCTKSIAVKNCIVAEQPSSSPPWLGLTEPAMNIYGQMRLKIGGNQRGRRGCSIDHCTVLFCTVLYSTVLYCTVMFCSALNCIILYCSNHKRSLLVSCSVSVVVIQ